MKVSLSQGTRGVDKTTHVKAGEERKPQKCATTELLTTKGRRGNKMQCLSQTPAEGRVNAVCLHLFPGR